MSAPSRSLAGVTPGRASRWTAERRFYTGMSLAIVVAVVLGFSRSFFLRPLFPEWAAGHAPHEGFFYLHGAVFTAWLLLLPTQSLLVAVGRVRLHRRLGRLGAWLAAGMVVLGVLAGLIAAGRPTGFVDVPVPPLQFLVTPLGDMVMFASFAALGIGLRRDPQSHKRLMLLASLAILDAGVARWPFGDMAAPSALPGFGRMDLVVDAFLLPMLVWDVASRSRPHAATVWGGAALVASQPLRMLLSQTDGWQAFARWAVGLLAG